MWQKKNKKTKKNQATRSLLNQAAVAMSENSTAKPETERVGGNMHLALQLFNLPVATAHVANGVTSFNIAEARLS